MPTTVASVTESGHSQHAGEDCLQSHSNWTVPREPAVAFRNGRDLTHEHNREEYPSSWRLMGESQRQNAMREGVPFSPASIHSELDLHHLDPPHLALPKMVTLYPPFYDLERRAELTSANSRWKNVQGTINEEAVVAQIC